MCRKKGGEPENKTAIWILFFKAFGLFLCLVAMRSYYIKFEVHSWFLCKY